MLLSHTYIFISIFWVAQAARGGVPGPNKDVTCRTRGYDCQKETQYSNIDGSCNNKDHPLWGATDIPHERILVADYSRISNTLLPTVRQVSNALKETRKEFSSTISNLHVLWGQMLSHDIALTPTTRNEDGTLLDCNCDNPHDGCININLESSDVQFTERRCFGLPGSRKAEGANGCNFPQEEQVNDCSSFIDATMVYGKTDREANALREPSRPGELRSMESPLPTPDDLLPTQDQIDDRQFAMSIQCPRLVHKPVDTPCFVAGDVRANENTGLATMQTIWMRYHNYIVNLLKSINPGWNSDKLFNEARKIVIALIQIITYREYLPPLLGDDFMQALGLKLIDVGYWNGYNPNINPTVVNAFTTASFRYGHSQLADKLTRRNAQFVKFHPDLKLEDSFFNTELLLQSTGQGVGSFVRGFMEDKAEKMDSSISEDFRNQLFREFGDSFGGDLLSFNTQRGRDHGLPGYNQYREICGLSRANSFTDLYGEIAPATVNKLRSVYQSVDDIDLYAGGIAERSVTGGQLGPTFACLMAYGFRSFRRGDRHWHEYEFSPSKFTPDQLSALRKASFARVLCDVTEYMESIYREPLLRSTKRIRCSSLPTFDISPWKESYAGNSNPGYQPREWTRWFVADARYMRKPDSPSFARRIAAADKNEICEDILDSEARDINFRLTHVRFACKPGTIQATDFPHEVSAHTYWTEWKSPSLVYYGLVLTPKDFGCSGDAIAIQARSTRGVFARETGDVFEKYSPKQGFVCRNDQQQYGGCNSYTIRVLCARASYKAKISPDRKKVLTIPSEGARGRSSYAPYYISKRRAIARPLKASKSENEKETENCSKYGICCNFQGNWFKITAVPKSVWRGAANMCSLYHMCCDSEFEWASSGSD